MSQALASLRDRHTFVANELEKSRGRIAAIIPLSASITPARVINVTLDALAREPRLLECEPRTIVRSVLHAAEVGLELGSPLGEAYIVPFGNKATMMPGYRGFVKLIRATPAVTTVKSIIVREGDEFDVDEGANKIHHVLGKGTIKNRGAVTHCYSRVEYQGGASQFEVMDRVELDAIKTESLRRAKGRPTPWRTHEDEMFKKCPLRRQAKWLDLTGGPTARNGESLARRCLELDTLESMRRGELGSLAREGFSSERADALKEMLRAQEAPAAVLDVEAELIDEEQR